MVGIFNKEYKDKAMAKETVVEEVFPIRKAHALQDQKSPAIFFKAGEAKMDITTKAKIVGKAVQPWAPESALPSATSEVSGSGRDVPFTIVLQLAGGYKLI